MTLITVLLLLFQSQALPPPFPRDGATKLLENDRVVVWDVAWLKQAYPVHRHVYDYAGVYYTEFKEAEPLGNWMQARPRLPFPEVPVSRCAMVIAS
jgi:hypothetical protein